MNETRTKVVKVRFTDEEWMQVEEHRRAAGTGTFSGYVRRRALEPELGAGAIADLAGQVSLTLNMLELRPRSLDHLRCDIGQLIDEIRRRKDT